MASIRIDQAEGLRRMVAKPAPRVLTFLSATPDHEKSATLLNLGASLARTGSGVLLVDACATTRGVGAGLDRMQSGTLLQAARSERRLADVVLAMPQGFGLAVMARGKLDDFEREDMAALFGRLDKPCRALANASGAVVLSVGYRLAPEARFPAAADDALAATRWAHANAARIRL